MEFGLNWHTGTRDALYWVSQVGYLWILGDIERKMNQNGAALILGLLFRAAHRRAFHIKGHAVAFAHFFAVIVECADLRHVFAMVQVAEIEGGPFLR